MREIYKDDTMYVVEYEPQCRTMAIGYEITKYYLSFPFMQFTTIDWKCNQVGYRGMRTSLHLTLSNKPVKSIRSKVFHPMLPNVYPQSCYPLESHLTCQVCLNLDRRKSFDIFEMISFFWTARSSDGEGWAGADALRETPLRNYKKWAEKTKEDPSFITDIKWPIKTKIGDLLKVSNLFKGYCTTKCSKK